MLWPDGVFTAQPGDYRTRADFHDTEPATDDDIARLVKTLRDRVLRLQRKVTG